MGHDSSPHLDTDDGQWPAKETTGWLVAGKATECLTDWCGTDAGKQASFVVVRDEGNQRGWETQKVAAPTSFRL